MPLPTGSVPLPVSERPFSAWNLHNHSAGIQDINSDSVPMGELSSTAKLIVRFASSILDLLGPLIMRICFGHDDFENHRLAVWNE